MFATISQAELQDIADNGCVSDRTTSSRIPTCSSTVWERSQWQL